MRITNGIPRFQGQKFHYPRVSPGDQRLTKSWRNSGLEIAPSLIGWVAFSSSFSSSSGVKHGRSGSFSFSCRVVLQTTSRLFALGPIFPAREGFQPFQGQGSFAFAFAFAFAFTPRTGFCQFFFEGFSSFSQGFQPLGEISFFLSGQGGPDLGFFGTGILLPLVDG